MASRETLIGDSTCKISPYSTWKESRETLNDHGIARDSQTNQIQYIQSIPKTKSLPTTMASRGIPKATKSNKMTNIKNAPAHLKQMVSNGKTPHSSRRMRRVYDDDVVFIRRGHGKTRQPFLGAR
ncbi:hypothetical protein N7472_005768 [Penicillium cf. griseofulvum]|uniref:Uncharacterized protein n=1 Tax=Penicillium cf. griseofulvum TaxID=2972120 RepID=A0A9W9JPB3_9EURO|nr:hypothetical protein N7472_005768 [Penicillium cf. griseofulvum]